MQVLLGLVLKALPVDHQSGLKQTYTAKHANCY